MINEICIKSFTPYNELGASISNCKKSKLYLWS